MTSGRGTFPRVSRVCSGGGSLRDGSAQGSAGPSPGAFVRRKHQSGALQRELEERIRSGSCVYCRAPAAPDRPLTREHVIPRARGGRRKDLRIIVPACARCNHRRGSQEIVLFLLARPRRIAAFLDYLGTLPPETVRQI